MTTPASSVDLDAPIPYLPTLTAVPDPTPTEVFDVVKVVEQDADWAIHHNVQVTLTDVQWRMLVGDIAARVLTLMSDGHPVIAKLMAAGVRPCDTHQQDALTDLVQLLAGPTHRGSTHTLPPLWDLTPEDADHLAMRLGEAALDPIECPCGAVVQQPTRLTGTCGGCVDRIGGDR